MPKKTTKSKTFKQAVALVLKLEEKSDLSPGQIAKRIEFLGYPNSRGAMGWHAYTVRRIIGQNRPEPRRTSEANRRKGTGSKSLKKAGSKSSQNTLATMPTTPAPTPQPTPAADERRGLKRMTRAGWESLPEPVREAVVERIYKEVVGQ